MKYILIAATMCLCTSFAGAEDITTIDGIVYTNAKVTRVEPDGITIMWASGIVKLPFETLPKETQDRYDYDPSAARQHIQTQATQAKQQYTRMQQQAVLDRQITEKTTTGWYKLINIMGDRALVTEQYYFPDARTGRLVTKDPIMVYGLPRDLVDGSQWQGRLFSVGIDQYTTVLGATATVKSYATTRELAARVLMQQQK